MLRIFFRAGRARHFVGKTTAQKDTIIDTTSDSQVNSNFPYRWSSPSLTFNNYFYLFLYLYITRISISNITPHLKSQKKSCLGTASNNITCCVCGGGGVGVGGGGGHNKQVIKFNESVNAFVTFVKR